MALSLAERNHPLYVGHYLAPGNGFPMAFVAPDNASVPEVLRSLYVRGTTTEADVKKQLFFDFRVPVPGASDAATWALIAADMFRESAIVSARLLDSTQCKPADLRLYSSVSSSGQTTLLMDSIAATLSDSLSTMVQAAEKAQKLVAAAGEARYAGASDHTTGMTQGWIARHDSRLEAASIFVPVAEELYSSSQVRPLYAMTKDIGGGKYNNYYTTAPEAPLLAGYEPQGIVGYVYPLESPPPNNTAMLVTYKTSAGLFVTTDDKAGWSIVPAGSTVARLEGYVAWGTVSDTTTRYRHFSCGTSGDASNPLRYVWSTNDTVPGCTQGDTVWVLRDPIAATSRATNVAFGKPTVQSSVYGGGQASNAVDGNADPNWSYATSSCTGFDANAWWQVDLGDIYDIDSVVIHDTMDMYPNTRLNNFYVFAAQQDMQGKSFSAIVGDSTITKVPVPGTVSLIGNLPLQTRARYVRIQLTGTNFLQLAEVEVLVKAAGDSRRLPLVYMRPDSAGAQRAVEMLRSLRIDPRISATRTVLSIADEMMRAMKLQYVDAYADVTTGAVMLAKLGIKQDELERGARYIEQVGNVFGRALLPDPENNATNPVRALNTAAPLTPTHPALLYARTAGRISPKSTAEEGYTQFAPISQNTVAAFAPGPAYARSSVISTLDYVRYLLTDSRTDQFADTRYTTAAQYTDFTIKTLQELVGFASQHASNRVRISFAPAAPNAVDTMSIILDGLGYTDPAVAKGELELWVGHAGLECGLTGRLGGKPCSAADYRFKKDNAVFGLGAADDVDVPRQGAIVWSEYKSDAPLGVIDPNTPLFIIRTAPDATRTVITAFSPPRLNGKDVVTIWLTPYGDYTARVLSEGLAPSVSNPEKAATSCAGVPYDVKVKLEDELTEAADGKDAIESSFVHYLRRADEAAKEADSLGDELVQQGLQMDMRAEEARDNLEDLCGGVINVSRLESYACSSGNKCNLAALLSNSSTITDAQVRNDAEGLKRCLGIGDAKVDATVGDKPLCVWNATDASRKYPACVCPSDGSGAPNSACAAKPCFYDLKGAACPAPENINGVKIEYARAFNLNLSVSKKDAPAADGDDPTHFGCYNLMALRAHYNSATKGAFSPVKDRKSLEWISQDSLRDIAQAMNFEFDEAMFSSISIGGAQFMKVGDYRTGPADNANWPCARHSMASGVGNSDPYASQACPASQSLFCGGLCGADTDSNQGRAATQFHLLGYRLQRAVETLKGISGASFRGMFGRYPTTPPGYAASGFTYVNAFPSWHPVAPSLPGMISSDRMTFCFGTSDVACWTRYRRDRAPGRTEFGQGWPEEPLFSWVPRGTKFETLPDSIPLYEVGDMFEFLRGTQRTVRMQTYDDVSIPSDLCFLPTGGIFRCGEEIRNALWPQVQATAAQSWTADDLKVIECAKSQKGFSKLNADGTNFWGLYEARPSASEVSKCFGTVGSPTFAMIGNTPISTFTMKAVAKWLVAYRSCTGNCASASVRLVGSERDYSEVLDALELACAVRERGAIGCDALIAQSVVPGAASDFKSMSDLAHCAADRIEGQMEKMLVSGLPQSIATDIQAGGVVNVFPANRGAFGETVGALASELVTLRQHTSNITSALRDLELALQRGRVELAVLGLDRDIADVNTYIKNLDNKILDKDAEIDKLRFRQTLSSQITRCVAAVAKAGGDWTAHALGKSAGAMVAAGAECADSIAQIALESKVNNLEGDIRKIKGQQIEASKKAIALGQQITGEQERLLMMDLAASLNETMDRINQSTIALQAAHASIQGTLAKIDQQRNQAGRLAAKVLMLGSDEMGRQYAVNSAMRSRMNTLRVRYEAARDRAIGASYLARRAIEQKLGVDMSLMDKDMTAVAAPKSWVDNLCTLSGIDYNKIRTEGKAGFSDADKKELEDKIPADYDYADGYVGNYVNKLSDFIESYRIDYPFQDSDSLAVVSLRDEILNVRRTNEECEPIQGPNLLYYTDGETAPMGADPHAWVMDCAASFPAAATTIALNLTADQRKSLTSSPSVAGVSPVMCRNNEPCGRAAGAAWQVDAVTCSAVPTTEGTGDQTTLAQSLAYRWSAPTCTGTSSSGCLDQAVPQGAVGAPVAASGLTLPSITTAGAGINGRVAIQTSGGQGLSFATYGGAYAPTYSVTFLAQMIGAPSPTSATIWSSRTQEGGTIGTVTLTLEKRAAGSVLGVYLKQTVGATTTEVLLDSFDESFAYPIITVRVDSASNAVAIARGGSVSYWSIKSLAEVQAASLAAPLALGLPSGSTAVLKTGELIVHETALTVAETLNLQRAVLAQYGYAPRPEALSASYVPGSYSMQSMRQNVVLGAGRYMLSWYEWASPEPGQPAFAGSILDAAARRDMDVVRDTAGSPMGLTVKEDPRMVTSFGSRWVRRASTFRIDTAGEVRVTLQQKSSNSAISGIQLEEVTSDAASYVPSPFFPTGRTLNAPRGSCEDTYGDKFRTSKYWKYDCEYFCPPGTGLDCGGSGTTSNLPKACFYESKFSLSLEEIEKGDLIAQAGFARGNFNYRFDDIAVNVVGTAVKDCSTSATPSACYANNNVLYSIRHDEPFRIRNYDGDEVRAQLYPGNIQQAQALLAERYITNPVSSADRNMLSDYWHGELKGRPLDGNFRLRIYDSEGLNWRAVEDVQLVLRYRYWTRER